MTKSLGWLRHCMTLNSYTTIHYGKKNPLYTIRENEQIYIALILNFYILQEEIQISTIHSIVHAVFFKIIKNCRIKR